jgi:hypothetical protein
MLIVLRVNVYMCIVCVYSFIHFSSILYSDSNLTKHTQTKYKTRETTSFE